MIFSKSMRESSDVIHSLKNLINLFISVEILVI